MNNNKKRLISFDDAVRRICSFIGDAQANKHYLEVSGYLADNIEEADIHSFHFVRSVPLVINENMTADLPDDCLNVYKVGVCCPCGNKTGGEIRLLGRNDSLCPIPENDPLFDCCDCGTTNEVDSTTTCCDKCTFHNVTAPYPYSIFNGSFNVAFSPYWYGYRSRQFKNGVYRYDRANNRLIIGSGYDTKAGAVLILEYQPSSGQTDKEVVIPKAAMKMLRNQVAMDFYASRRDLQMATYMEQQFRIHRDLWINTTMDYSLKDIMAAFRTGYGNAPRR